MPKLEPFLWQMGKMSQEKRILKNAALMFLAKYQNLHTQYKKIDQIRVQCELIGGSWRYFSLIKSYVKVGENFAIKSTPHLIPTPEIHTRARTQQQALEENS
jgi:hypothetical protein